MKRAGILNIIGIVVILLAFRSSGIATSNSEQPARSKDAGINMAKISNYRQIIENYRGHIRDVEKQIRSFEINPDLSTKQVEEQTEKLQFRIDVSREAIRGLEEKISELNDQGNAHGSTSSDGGSKNNSVSKVIFSKDVEAGMAKPNSLDAVFGGIRASGKKEPHGLYIEKDPNGSDRLILTRYDANGQEALKMNVVSTSKIGSIDRKALLDKDIDKKKGYEKLLNVIAAKNCQQSDSDKCPNSLIGDESKFAYFPVNIAVEKSNDPQRDGVIVCKGHQRTQTSTCRIAYFTGSSQRDIVVIDLNRTGDNIVAENHLLIQERKTVSTTFSSVAP